MIDISIAIHKINPNAGFVIRDNDVNQIEWADGTTPISKADIETKQAELQTEYDAAKYQRDRKTEYPSIADQLDMQYWDKKNGTTTWVDAIAKVKSDIPKS